MEEEKRTQEGYIEGTIRIRQQKTPCVTKGFLAPRAGLEPLEDRRSCAIYGVFLKFIVQIGRLEGYFPTRGARTRYTHPLTTRHS